KNELDRRDQYEILPRYFQKANFDVTTSGANEGSGTFDYPNTRTFRELTFFGCAGPCSILTQTPSY
ncbi:hypothetical protein PMAYCL1PPCAC_31318, partial [Pristionchus mayeri]